MSKKCRLVLMENKEFQPYKVETVEFKQIAMKRKELNQEVGLKLMTKKAKVSFEDKASLRSINRYQFRRDLDSHNNIPLQSITGIGIN